MQHPVIKNDGLWVENISGEDIRKITINDRDLAIVPLAGCGHITIPRKHITDSAVQDDKNVHADENGRHYGSGVKKDVFLGGLDDTHMVHNTDGSVSMTNAQIAESIDLYNHGSKSGKAVKAIVADLDKSLPPSQNLRFVDDADRIFNNPFDKIERVKLERRLQQAQDSLGLNDISSDASVEKCDDVPYFGK